MNRQNRRARAKHAAKDSDAHIVAVHEAGHAVAKVLAAGELGYSINEAIDRIEVGTYESLGRSFDGRMIRRSRAATCGPMFSRDIDEASVEFRMRDHGARQASEFFSKIVELGRTAGADIGRWFRAQVFDAMSGSMAEAIFSHRTFCGVWNGYQAEGDLLSVARAAHWAGVEDELLTTISRVAVLFACVMEKPEVWAAVISLANTLPAVGIMEGAEAVAIIAGVIPEAELAGIFGKALERVAELERDIGAADLAIGITPDGSTEIIKGFERSQKIKNAGIKEVEVQCHSSIFVETLWYAFGDGAASREGTKAA